MKRGNAGCAVFKKVFSMYFRGFWQDFANFESELRKAMAVIGTDKIPKTPELKRRGGNVVLFGCLTCCAGYIALIHAIYLHGGCKAVAERLGIGASDDFLPEPPV